MASWNGSVVSGRVVVLAAGLAAVTALLAACGGGGGDGGTATPTASPGTGSPTPSPSPSPTRTPAPSVEVPPLLSGFYNGGEMRFIVTELSAQADGEVWKDATGYPVSAVASLGGLGDDVLAKLYLFMNGVAGPNLFGFQASVLDSFPGDEGYTPLRRVYAVTWKDTATPRELKSEGEVLAARDAGELSVDRTQLVANAPVVGSAPPVLEGYLGGETVKYTVTDLSDSAEALALGDAIGSAVNFAPRLASVPETVHGKMYVFTNGVTGPGPERLQPNVLSAGPGQPGYAAIWSVYRVTWAETATPRELKTEADIQTAQNAGELTTEKTGWVQDSPVLPKEKEEATPSPSPSPSP